MYSIEKLTGGYASKPVIEDITFEIEKSQLFGILGPNGSGKTTLLKMLSGILPYSSGQVLLKGKPIKQYSAKELAKTIAVLSQHSQQSFSYTVKETVSLGRYAHQKGWFQSWSDEDEAIVQRVMAQTGISHFENHQIPELSGGERQRVFLAQALAQEPEILLLDEPTNHLDLSYQKELLDLLKEWTENSGLTVVSIFHDLNLAGLYCDQILLMDKGKIQINDQPNEVLQEERIRQIFRTQVQKQPHPKVPAPQIVLLRDRDEEKEGRVLIDDSLLKFSSEYIALTSTVPLRTMSSGVVGAGIGWNDTFVNRHVNKNYRCEDHRAEMATYLREKGFEPSQTVGMMTAVFLEDACYHFYEENHFSALIVVTAGVGNAVDASMSGAHCSQLIPGTINTWVFVNGELTEEAFIQSIMTATEAKAKAMVDLTIEDAVTKTIATGTSTDSILIAATQRGHKLEFAGTITPLGKMIGKGVYECAVEAINKSTKRKKNL
ncbi:heme ABC transporter ATP-binding protein [Cytobacillus purgationiresistens]|uniref:Iron complex transport system ATP-binding protein n=1 Tax=Cytobacillus purgationiresistens TaxID=863449 RepID=A0ABU0APM8_9BACI|nr:heme ABC transporter ATP-binding protein [Cytobacillus purgationiresistens]MDQ0273241.1 iron complex transport system ATP-binding protein [Cytobacillus purgationiresistens]